jgi:hypothetical protein
MSFAQLWWGCALFLGIEEIGFWQHPGRIFAENFETGKGSNTSIEVMYEKLLESSRYKYYWKVKYC